MKTLYYRGVFVLSQSSKGTKIRYRDYAKATWNNGHFNEEVFREVYIQSDICGRISLQTTLIASKPNHLDINVDGHHVVMDITNITVDGVNRGRNYVVFAEGDM